jgi:hypothetical protein
MQKKQRNATIYNTGAHELQPAYKPNYYMTTSFTIKKLCIKTKKMQTDYNPGAHELQPA